MSGLDPLFPAAGALAMTILFTAAAAHKLAAPAGFHAAVGEYRLLPPGLVGAAAVVIPWLEFAVAAAALAAPFLGQRLLAPAAGMLLLYALAMAVNLVRGRRDIGCGCAAFGAPDAAIGWPMVARNLAAGVIVLVLAASPREGRALEIADAIALAGMGLVLPACYVAFAEWQGLRRRIPT